MNKWGKLKVALVVLAAMSSARNTPYQAVNDSVSWEFVASAFLFFPVIVLFGLFVLKLVLRRNLSFEMPNWQSNPFRFSHPEHFFHLGGLLTVAGGLAGSLSLFMRFGVISTFFLGSVAYGLGIFAGLWLLKVVHDKQSSEL